MTRLVSILRMAYSRFWIFNFFLEMPWADIPSTSISIDCIIEFHDIFWGSTPIICSLIWLPMIYRERKLSYTSIHLIHSSNIKAMKDQCVAWMLLFSWFDTKISFEDPKLAYLKSFEMNPQQPCSGYPHKQFYSIASTNNLNSHGKLMISFIKNHCLTYLCGLDLL